MTLHILHYVWKSITRNRLRTALTTCGIAVSMFLFVFIEGLQNGVAAATEGEAVKNTLVVFQKSRFCPATSALPERYETDIAKIDGVTRVVPMEIFVNNCRASLDVVTFRGVPPAKLLTGEKQLQIIDGSLDNFGRKKDAAVVGRHLAGRRNLQIGDRLQVANIGVEVAAIFDSPAAGETNVAYVHLDYLQRAQGDDAVGRVTQFEVGVGDATNLEAVAAKIDDRFRTDEIQTTTKSHKAFLNSAAGDLLGLIRFTRYLGLVCVLLVLALTANTVYVMVQDRVKEHAVLQTLGFRSSHLFTIVVVESLLLALGGGFLGTATAAAILQFGSLGFGAEGVNVTFLVTPVVICIGMIVSAATGILAGFMPALQAAFAPIVESLRKV